MLRDNRVEDIQRLRRLYQDVPKGLDPIAALLKEYVTREGMEIVRKHTRDVSELDYRGYVQDFLDLHDKYTQFLLATLDNPIFHRAVKDGFEYCVNQHVVVGVGGTGGPAPTALPTTPGETALNPQMNGAGTTTISSSELLSSFCDSILRNAGVGEKLTDEEVDVLLDKVVNFLGLISDKDVFQECYRKHLGKRLLSATVREDVERSFLSKLKLKYGAPFTSRLEGMLQDKNTSAEQQSAFRDWLELKHPANSCDFSVQVLTQGFWPVFRPDQQVVVPDCVVSMMAEYKLFYDSRTQSRVLKWVHHLGNATLVGNFKKGQRELQVTSYQACVLLLMNSTDRVTGKFIVDNTAIEWDEVKKALQSLALGKYRILTRGGDATSADAAPAKGDIKDAEQFVYNEDFTTPQRKIKIPNVVAKICLKQSAQVKEQVDEDRRHAIEACLVRVMKSRKQCEHQQLMTECMQLLQQHFKPDPKVIKKRIEDLIAREYLERHPDKPSMYRYVTH
jgi:cullin 1